MDFMPRKQWRCNDCKASELQTFHSPTNCRRTHNPKSCRKKTKQFRCSWVDLFYFISKRPISHSPSPFPYILAFRSQMGLWVNCTPLKWDTPFHNKLDHWQTAWVVRKQRGCVFYWTFHMMAPLTLVANMRRPGAHEPWRRNVSWMISSHSRQRRSTRTFFVVGLCVCGFQEVKDSIQYIAMVAFSVIIHSINGICQW